MEIVYDKANPTNNVLEDFAQRFPLCYSMSPDSKIAIYDICTGRSYKRRETIIDAYQGRGYVYIVLEGSVFIFLVSPETGHRRIFWICEPGDILGDTHLWGHPSNRELETYAEAAEDTLLMALPRDKLATIVEQHKELLAVQGRVLSRRLRHTESRLVESTFLSIEDRLLAEIVRLGTRWGQDTSRGYHLDIRLTHEQLADLIGVARPTLSKRISSLMRRGILLIDEEGHLVIPPKKAYGGKKQLSIPCPLLTQVDKNPPSVRFPC